MCVAKIIIYQLIEMPVFTHTRSHVSVHIPKVKYREGKTARYSQTPKDVRRKVNGACCLSLGEINLLNDSILSIAISHLTKPSRNTESALKI